MLLAIDVGNTNITYGLFKGQRLVGVWREETRKGKVKSIKFKVQNKEIDDVIISSVVPRIDRPLEKAIIRQLKIKPVFVSYKNAGLKIHLKRKEQVGADRLVNALAVSRLYGGPAIVVDFGTATTFCAINSKGEYLGGAIAPGIGLSRDALHLKTAKLPLIDFGLAKDVIGKNTKDAMLSGLFFGYVSLVEGMVERFKRTIGRRAKVIATGGFSSVIGKKTRVFDIIDPDLALKGLKIIWEDWTRKPANKLRGFRHE